jgi:choline dehydrogenase-like flavoprotein
MADRHFDVIIIGAGQGGGTTALALAPTGKRILLLERGDFLPRSKDNWDAYKVFRDEVYSTPETWHDLRNRPFRPKQYYWVGGLTKFYGATLIRFRAEDFGEIRHIDGMSPAWPISYDDLEPYYTRAERLFQVHGQRGDDPTEAPASEPFPCPPVSHEPMIAEIAERMSGMDLHPFHLPLGLRLDEQNPGDSPCIRCDTCDGFVCPLRAKSDAEVTCVRPAVEHENVNLLTRSRVVRLDTDASGGTVRGVVVERDGEKLEFSADVVVLSAGAINSALLLLASRSDRHPNGLGNGSGLVGRNLMLHTNCAMISVMPFRKNPTVFPKTLCVNDFYFNDPFDKDWEYPLGDIQLLGNLTPETLKSVQPIVPMPVARYLSEHMVSWWQSTEDLPQSRNRIELTPEGRVQLSYWPSNVESVNRLTARVKQMLRRMGFRLFVTRRSGPDTVGHQCGTLRFGADPGSSVLDVNCRLHEVDNLYVVDASFFPSSTALNPALTIAANALRVADYLTDRYP